MKFSENLKTQRILNGVKQEDIATLCDVTRSAVSNWENGRRLPHIDIIQSLAKFFNVTMEDLLGTDIKYVKQLTKEEIVTVESKDANYVDSLIKEKMSNIKHKKNVFGV